jgi:hypothetical protein
MKRTTESSPVDTKLRSNVVDSKSRGAGGAGEAGGEKVISLNATPYEHE